MDIYRHRAGTSLLILGMIWNVTPKVTESVSGVGTQLDVSDEDPFSDMFDLSMLRPQSPFISDRNKVLNFDKKRRRRLT